MIIIAIISNLFLSITFSIDPFMERIFVSVFLFSIGYQIAISFTKMYLKRLLILTGLCTLILVSLHGFAYFFVDELKWLVGPIMFAFNDELFYRIVTDIDEISFIYFWAKIQMLLIFVLTPIFLLLVAYFHPKKDTSTSININEVITIKGRYSFTVIVTAIFSVYFKITWLGDTLPFIFDFVITMLLGIIVGLWSNKNLQKDTRMKLNTEFHQLGTFGLYGFIISAIYSVIFIDIQLFSWNFFLVVVAKTLIIAIITIFAVLRMFKHLTYYESIVAMVATWTFILNAPVTCMHGMRTAVNKYGPVPGVLLIVPPVILWLVNYIHLLLFLIL